MAERAPALSITDLEKTFTIHELAKHISGCRGVDLRVEHGEFVGITGRSGSGKSTVLKLIYRTYLPERGSIVYDSAHRGAIDLCSATDRQILYLRRREIGYVSQFLAVVPRTTAVETIEHAVREAGGGDEEARERAREMLEHFELERGLWDSYVSTFSGGEKLRLNVARAMAKRPRLLLLDEPTASLDERSKGLVRDLMERLKAEGTTMVGVFHDLGSMRGVCDRECRMDLGRLLAS